MLYDLDVHKLHTILPNFHNLQFRYDQMVDALHNADITYKRKCKRFIAGCF